MSANWYWRDEEGEHGPVSPGELLEMARRGELSPESPVRKGENGPWHAASRVKDLRFRSASDEAAGAVEQSQQAVPVPRPSVRQDQRRPPIKPSGSGTSAAKVPPVRTGPPPMPLSTRQDPRGDASPAPAAKGRSSALLYFAISGIALGLLAICVIVALCVAGTGRSDAVAESSDTRTEDASTPPDPSGTHAANRGAEAESVQGEDTPGRLSVGIKLENAEAYCDRRLLYAEKGEQDKAIADFTEAIRLNPNLATAYYARAGVYLAQGKLSKAEADYGTARRLGYAPESASARSSRIAEPGLMLCPSTRHWGPSSNETKTEN